MEQNTNYLPHIIVGLVALLAGWAIGFFDSNLRAEKKIKQAEESAKKAIHEAEDKAAEARKVVTSAPANPIVMDNPGILRLTNENGSLSLDLDGEHVSPISLSSDQRKRLIEILNLIRPILEGKPAPAIPPPPTPSEDLLSRLDAVSASRSAPATVSTQPPATTSSVASTKNKPTASGKSKKEDEPEVAPTSMVGQINAILQLRIANTPLAAQGLTMIETPSGNVNVYVGVNKYEGVEDVPNEEAKAAIRAAIAEWEKKYTPGL